MKVRSRKFGLPSAAQFFFQVLDLHLKALVLCPKVIEFFISVHAFALADWPPVRNGIALLNSYEVFGHHEH